MEKDIELEQFKKVQSPENVFGKRDGSFEKDTEKRLTRYTIRVWRRAGQSTSGVG